MEGVQSTTTMKAVKINNAEWLAVASGLAEHVERFCQKIKVKGLHGPNLFAYIAQVVQFGGTMQEFWVVFNDEDRPIAFAAWQVMGLPMVAKVYMPFLHSWETGPGAKATGLLSDEYMKFGEKHNAVWYAYDPISEKHYSVLERRLKAHGHNLQRTGTISCVSKRTKK